MALRSGLTLYCYTLPVTGTPSVAAYTSELVHLTFTTVSPGGFGQLSAIIKLGGVDVRLPQPQLSLFAHVCLRDGPLTIFRGEVMQAPLTLDSQNGDYVQITALGIGNQLRDDPYSPIYTAQTPQQIAQAELTRHTSTFIFWPQISTDASQMFPDNPVMTSSPSYAGRTAEEIILDQMALAGDYAFGVWDDPKQTDAAGFPLGRINVHLRDTTTTSYRAALLTQEISAYTIDPDATRAYNYIEVVVNDGSGGVNLRQAKDSRLNGSSLAQNAAPFRVRKLRRDLSGVTTITPTLGTQIANTYLAQFQNASNKVSLTLAACRDALGNDLALWQVRADANIYVEDMAVRGQQLPTAPTARVNQFYILSTTYTETETDISLKLECDNFTDMAERFIARLTLAADQKARGLGYASLMAPFGAPQKIACGLSNIVASGASVLNSATEAWPQVLSQVPSSVTLSGTGTNISGVAASSLTVYGFVLSGTSVAAGNCSWTGTATSVGNTLHAVDRRRRTFDWHCSGCDTLHRGLKLHGPQLIAEIRDGAGPVLAAVCPSPGCGTVEAFNAALSAEHEDALVWGAHHAEQARHIRRLAAHHGLVPTAAAKAGKS